MNGIREDWQSLREAFGEFSHQTVSYIIFVSGQSAKAAGSEGFVIVAAVERNATSTDHVSVELFQFE